MCKSLIAVQLSQFLGGMLGLNPSALTPEYDHFLGQGSFSVYMRALN